jgi:tRNA(Ile)-lysidine synthase
VIASATTLAARVDRTIRDQQLFSPGDTIVVALSGGADSTALLDVLAGDTVYSPRLIAAHLNHCLRGRESDDDEEFACTLASRYGIPFESRRVDVKEFAEKERLNLEDAGRRVRLAFFHELSDKWQASAIALAHHADDQAETVLMRLLRGAGANGLSGMSYKNGQGIIRPLLDATRPEIEAYLSERGIGYRDDSSNRDTVFQRNRIRHELLPLLEQYNPAVRNRLTATAYLLSEEDDLLSRLAKEAAARSCTVGQDALTCDIACLKELHPALLRRVLRYVLESLAGNLDHFNHCHVMSLERMIVSVRPNARLSLPQGITAFREYGALLVRRDRVPEIPGVETVTISGVGTSTLPGGASLRLENSAFPPDFASLTPDTAFFDLDKTPFPWQIRTFRPGDRIAPLGMTGTKKVKSLFIDQKIPVSLRSRIPLVFCNDTLIWVCGLRISSRAGLDNGSSRIVKAVLSGPWCHFTG